MKLVIELPGYPLLLSASQLVDRGYAVAWQDVFVYEAAYVHVLQVGSAEVAAALILKQLCNAALISRFQHIQRDGLAGVVGLLASGPLLVTEPVHLIKVVAGSAVEVLGPTDFHEAAPDKNTLLIHLKLVREFGVPGQEGGNVGPGIVCSFL